MPKIDADRFLKDLNDLRKIGQYKTGVHRPTYSPQDMESRRWLMARLEEIGLEASIDGIGNVYGRHKGPGPHLLAGSHIESQNQAGWLDGALGVMAAVALARAGLPVDVAAFADEEGHFEGGFLGSKSIIGILSEEEIDRSRSRNDGTPLRDALAAAGLAGKPRMQLEPRPAQGLPRDAYRAGHAAGECRAAGRRRHRHRRHLAVAHHHRGHAGPCRRHHHGGAPRRRPRPRCGCWR